MDENRQQTNNQQQDKEQSTQNVNQSSSFEKTYCDSNFQSGWDFYGDKSSNGNGNTSKQSTQSQQSPYGNWSQTGHQPHVHNQHWGNVPPNGYNPQQSYGTNGQPYWNQNLNGAPPPNWGNNSWQNGAGFQQPPNWPPPEEPKKKMNLGVKIFLIIIAVLAVGFIVGFSIFGALVVAHQGDHPADGGGSSSSSGSSSQSSSKKSVDENLANVPDKTDPDFMGLTISPATGDTLTPEQVYEKTSASMVSVLASSGSNAVSGSSAVSQGSGIIATCNGYILTNAHVIDYSKTAKVEVITHDQKKYEGVVVGFDKDTDLAVIKIEAEGLPAATFGYADDLSVGETVIAIGNPGGVRYSGSMTMGIVSAVNRSVENYSSTGITYIQTDTAINPGNSGGGLINMRGQVVGINTIKVVSSGYEGMGFSIPISKVKSILDTLIRDGSIPAVGKLGIKGGTQYLPVSGETYSVASGVLIASIESDSPLQDTDLKNGDLIIGFNGAAVTTLEDVYEHLRDYRVGEEITLTIRRIKDDKDSTFEIKTKIMQRESKDSASSSKS